MDTSGNPLSPEDVQRAQEALLDWFQANGRDFPWRNTSSPFAILVAEKLLQQTQARDIVVQTYTALISRYPQPSDMASANQAELESLILPLGLSYRAGELRQLAQALLDKHGGSVPADLKELMRLPGVGQYIARAVLSFAYRQDIAVVDTNVARFLYRFFGIPGTLPANPARSKPLIDLATSLVPPGQSRPYNLAVIDLCAKVCKPRVPACSECPVRQYCMHARSC